MFAEREQWRAQLEKAAAHIDELSKIASAAQEENTRLKQELEALVAQDRLVKTAMQIVESTAVEPPMSFDELIDIGTKYVKIEKEAAEPKRAAVPLPSMGKIATRHSGMASNATERMMLATLKIQGEEE